MENIYKGEVTQSIDVSDTTQALVCSQIFGVLPYRAFRRQRFDSFTSCMCVTDLTAVCQPDTFYPTVAPGTPEAALAQEHSAFGGDKFIEVLNAFSVQQTCFFEHLRGQKLSPPRPCAFSWARDDRPACDCAQPPEPPAEVETAQVEAVAPMDDTKPAAEAPAPEVPASEAPAPEVMTPEVMTPEVMTPEASTSEAPTTTSQAPVVTERATKDAVQSVERSEQAQSATSELQEVSSSELPGQRAADLGEERRGPVVAEESHLRRARSARRH
ncbi:hypothetical protein FJT64_014270 [Amphibalanus amphitrite]|uniref:Uncharacterized protein n=1 Tax=Amphibalanus amphitrite TaxID=1232801 RepID=A0A6A4UU92_AMPAM|nr:hypothetical protein FJT64_014270 [Amphibalanus amphitrite]